MNNNPNRTVVVFSQYIHPFFSGPARNIRALGKRLIEDYGYEFKVIANDTELTGVYEEVIDGIHIIRLPSWNVAKPFGDDYFVPKPIPLFKALWRLREEHVDIISTQTRFFFLSFIGVLYGKLTRIPVVHTDRGSSFVKQGKLIVRTVAYLVDQTIGRFVLSFANQVVGVSDATCEFDKKIGAKNPITIYNGVDLSLWQNPVDPNYVREMYQIPQDAYVIAFHSRMVKAKGVGEIIEVLSELTLPNMKLLLIGDGVNRDMFEQQAQKSPIKDDIMFLGELTQDEISKLLQIAQLYLHPSYTEGIPTSVIEAVASKTFAIASNVGGTKEIFCDDSLGSIVEAHDNDALKQQIQKAYDNKSAIESLPECFIKRFDWAEITRRYNELFSSLISD